MPDAPTFIQQGLIDDGNVVFSNSKVPIKLHLAYHTMIPFAETGVLFDDVEALKAYNDDLMNPVRKMRDDKKADLVLLLVKKTEGYAGWSYQICANEDEAVAVVDVAWSSASRAFLHEVGHLIGTRHDDDPETQPFPYGHGYLLNAFSCSSLCSKQRDGFERRPLFSNPGILERGKPFGTENLNNNAKVLANRGFAVAQFR
jgi:hypothetical protein